MSGLASVNLLKPMVAALICAGLAATGCGDSDQVRATPAELTPSKRDYLSRADGLCGLYQDRIQQAGSRRFGITAKDIRITPNGEIVFRNGRRPADAKVSEFVGDTVVVELAALLERLHDLIPPAGDAARVELIYDAADSAVAALRRDPLAFADKASLHRLTAKPDRLARDYGLKVCSIESLVP